MLPVSKITVKHTLAFSHELLPKYFILKSFQVSVMCGSQWCIHQESGLKQHSSGLGMQLRVQHHHVLESGLHSQDWESRKKPRATKTPSECPTADENPAT